MALRLYWCCFLLGMSFCITATASEKSFPLEAERILFLGDSITNAGGYVYEIEAQLRAQQLDPMPEIINLGLSSETCTGLSEPDHPFPRPDVHERLDRALEKIKPDVVVACYGMNDGIYHPFDQQRFEQYQAGIKKLVDKVHASGAKIVLLAPPPFDPLPVKEKLKPAGSDQFAYFAVYDKYDEEVIKEYGAWLMLSGLGDMRINTYLPMRVALKEKRKTDSNYTMAPDGVHPNADGHQVLANTILDAWGVHGRVNDAPELKKLVSQRGRILHDAWLSEVGHLRPGVKAGLPLEEAQQKATELEEKIQKEMKSVRATRVRQREANDGTVFEYSYPPSLEEGKLSIGVTYYFWMPQGAKYFRSLIVHQHGCGVGAAIGGRTSADDYHWQELARKWDSILVGVAYEAREQINCRSWCDPRNGSAEQFRKAIRDVSRMTMRYEISAAPWCLWGHSGGGFWASLMQTESADEVTPAYGTFGSAPAAGPKKIVAIWLQSGTAYGYWEKGEVEAPKLDSATYQVPVLGCPGLKEKDHPRFKNAWNGLHDMQAAYQKAGAPFFEIAADPKTGHECGDSRYLAIPYFDFWLKHRLPNVEDLPPLPTFKHAKLEWDDGQWDLFNKKGTKYPSLKPVKNALTAWETEMEPLLEEFRTTGTVADTTPPSAPTDIAIAAASEGVEISWNAKVDLESGLRCFVIERDGKRIGQIPETLKNPFGKPVLQGMSYHDTPNDPHPKMSFTDQSEGASEDAEYTVRAVNTSELISKN